MNQIENFKRGVEMLSDRRFNLVFSRKAKTPSGQMVAEFAHRGAEDKEDRIIMVIAIDGTAKIVKKDNKGEKTTLVNSYSAAHAVMHYDDHMDGRKPREFFN